ncbi:MAG: hypothetical protein FVQ77_02300 [Cytophagales bacterium]|nr:hypothetical protein [Cytophagales bacterium]
MIHKQKIRTNEHEINIYNHSQEASVRVTSIQYPTSHPTGGQPLAVMAKKTVTVYNLLTKTNF